MVQTVSQRRRRRDPTQMIFLTYETEFGLFQRCWKFCLAHGQSELLGLRSFQILSGKIKESIIDAEIEKIYLFLLLLLFTRRDGRAHLFIAVPNNNQLIEVVS